RPFVFSLNTCPCWIITSLLDRKKRSRNLAQTPPSSRGSLGGYPAQAPSLVRHAIAQVDDPRAERPRLDQLEIEPALALRIERDATADPPRIDDTAALVA